jgi:hypothetical protein
MSVAYPDSIPMEDLSRVVGILTGMKPVDKAVIAKSIWTVTGYVLKLSVGEPTDTAMVRVGHNGDCCKSASGAWHQLGSYPADAGHFIDDETAAALLQVLALPDEEPHAEFKAAGIFESLLGSDFIKQKIAEILLPFLLKKLQEWLNSLGQTPTSASAAACCAR